MTIGDRISLRRKELNLTQEELACKMGYKSKAAISKIETGVNDITQSTIAKFAEVLDTSVPYLMGWDELNDTIGERIAALRLRRGMTQGELGEAIGESKQTIYKYEHGIVTNIPLEKVEKIAAVLRCPPVALTGWEDEGQADPAQQERDKRMLAAFRLLPAEYQEFLIAQTEGAQQNHKDPGAP